MDTGTRLCAWCSVEKPANQFSARGRQCSGCYTARQRDSYARYREKMRTDPAAAALRAARSKRWNANNKEKVRAQRSAKKALRKGKLVRPETCERCGVHCKPQMHHVDYSRRLDVRWLCGPCHRTAHGIVHRIVSDVVPVPPRSRTRKTSARCPACGVRGVRIYSAVRDGLGDCGKCGTPLVPGPKAVQRVAVPGLVTEVFERPRRKVSNGVTVHPLSIHAVKDNATGDTVGWFSQGHHETGPFLAALGSRPCHGTVRFAFWRKLRHGDLFWLFPVERCRAALPVTFVCASASSELVCAACTEARAEIVGDER
jgi:hypothetical protein